MLPASISVALGLLFVSAGASAIWLILDASARSQDPQVRERRIRAHRLAGYLFVALFCFMGWFMIVRTRGWSGELPTPTLFHIVIATLMAPLLFVKILIARYYKSYHSILTGLGLSLFTLGFVLVASTAGPYLFRRTTVKNISLEPVQMGPAKIDLEASESLMQRRCSRCHALERVIGARKDARGWLVTIDRMRALPGSGISESDAKTILSYLLSENSIDTSSPEGEITVGKALVNSHCGRCHALDRTYESARSADEWRKTVTRMAGYAQGTEGVLKPGETERIIRFLSLTQTPETLRKDPRPAPEIAAPGSKASSENTRNSGTAVPTATVLLAITAALGTLVFRRPKSTRSSALAPIKQAAPRLKKPLIVQLVRSERQTHDCVTLRFRLAPDSRFEAQPGQFLTFQWLIEGQRVARSYSISSSPTQTGHIEITVKKQGFISTFLNEQIPDGYTVEAQGPFGQFCFDERTHRKIILIAGGSGITPLMSMLRYIDDLCLDTDVTLFYSVRSQADIIFERELTRLRNRLVTFHLCVFLTRPDNNWHGLTGRLSRELLIDKLGERRDSAYFVCGPDAFMSHVKGLLESLGIEEGRIKQEQFGIERRSPLTEGESPQSVCNVEFARTGRSCQVSAGQTLLEVAEANGIPMPFACRQGQCGTCTTRLLEGEVQMATENGLNSDLKAQGYILTCVAQAQGSVRLDA